MKRRLLQTPRRAWDSWWFGPVSPVPLGLFRIVFGVLVFAYGLLLFPDRVIWFSEHGAMTAMDTDRFNQRFSMAPRIDLLHGSIDDRWLTLFFVVFLVAALGLALGLATRLCSIAVFVQMLTLHNRNEVIHNSGDVLMMVMMAYLMLAPAGAALSLDRLIRLRLGREDKTLKPVAPWAQRLMQLQIGAIYCSTSLSKIWGQTLWIKGTAVFYAIRLDDITRLPVPWLDGHHIWFIHLVTWGAIAVELSLWTLIWVPRLRLYVLAAGTLLHLGIEYAMLIPLFSFTMISCYILFLKEADLQNFARWVRRKTSRFRPAQAALSTS